MHEMSLAEGVLQIIEDAAEEGCFERVSTVRLEIGQLAAVAPDALRFCFDAVVRGSLAEGATLEIVEVPGSGWCGECEVTVPMPEIVAVCPYCGNCQLQATGGLDMKVVSLDVE